MTTPRRVILAVLLACCVTTAWADAPPPRCEGSECIVDVLDAAGQKLLERRPKRDELRLVVLKPSPALLASLARVPWVTSLELRGYVADLTPLAKLTALRSLAITGLRATSLEPLAALRELYSLRISLCEGTVDSDFRVLANARKLAVLQISSCPNFTSAAPLGTLPRLDAVELVNTKVESLAGLANAPLSSLKVQGSAHDLAALATMPRLSRLELFDLPRATELPSLGALQHLERITLYGTGIKALPTLAPGKLQHATLTGSRSLVDLGAPAGLSALRDLDLSGTSIADLRPLAACQALAVLYLGHSPVRDLAPLATAKGLAVVIVSDDAPATTIEPFRKLRPEVAVRTETQARQAAMGPR